MLLRFQLAKLVGEKESISSNLSDLFGLLAALQMTSDISGGSFRNFADDIAKVYGQQYPSTLRDIYDEYEMELPNEMQGDGKSEDEKSEVTFITSVFCCV